MPTSNLNNVYSIERFPVTDVDSFVILIPTKQTLSPIENRKQLYFENTYSSNGSKEKDVVLQIIDKPYYHRGADNFIKVLHASRIGCEEVYEL